jgi:hypothetical protein
MNMRNNAEFMGSGIDLNGIRCRYYINRLTGVVYKAYDLEELEKREETKKRRPALALVPSGYHKRGRR